MADALHFLYGLLFLVGGALAMTIRRSGERSPDWRWLAAFGVVHGFAEWFSLVPPLFPDEAWIPLAHSALVACSAICLMELFRRSLPLGGRWRRAGAVSHLLLVVLAGIMLLEARSSEQIVEWLLMPVAVAMASVPLARFAHQGDGRRSVAGLAVVGALLAYGVGEPLVEWWFGDQVGGSAPLALGLSCGLVFMVGLGVFAHVIAVDGKPEGFRRLRCRRMAVFAVMAVLLLVSGLALTEALARRDAQATEKRIAAGLSSLSSAVSELITRGEFGATTMALWPETLRVVADPSDAAARDLLVRRMDLFQVRRGLTLVYLLDEQGICIAGCSDARDLIGKDYSFRPYFRWAMADRPRSYGALGTVTSRRGIYLSKAVFGQDGRRLGAVVVKQGVELLDRQLQSQAGSMVVSPEGVVFAASERRLLWRTAWPLAPADREALIASGQYGNQDFRPLAAQSITSGGVRIQEAGGGVVYPGTMTQDGWRVAIVSGHEGTAQLRLSLLGMLAALLALLAVGFGLVTALGDRGFELDAHERLLTGVLTGIDQGIATLVPERDGSGRMTDLRWVLANPAAEDQLRQPALPGRQLSLTMPSWLQDGTAAWMEEVLAGRQVDNHREIEMRWPGQRTWLRITVSRQGEGLILVLADVTARRKAEDEQQRREALVRRVLDASPNPMFVLDQDGRVRFANHACEAVLGRQVSDIEGLSVVQAITAPAVAEQLEESRRWVAEQGVGFEWEAAVTGAGNRRYDLLVACRPLAQEDGGVHVLVACSDVTDLHAKEEEIRRTRDFMRTVLDQSPVHVLVCGEDGRVLLANRPFVEFVGAGNDERSVIGRTLAEIMPVAEEGSEQHDQNQSIMAGRPAEDGERLFTDRWGCLRWLFQRRRRLTLPDGGSALLGVSADVTPLKEAVEAANAARSRAEGADRAKSDFLANMSHEIRTPMNGVMGMLELLQGTQGLNTEQLEYARTAHRSAEALLGLLNDILDWSKIESGRLELDRHPFSLAEQVFDVADLFRARLSGGEVELVVDVDPQLPRMIEGDSSRMRQIIINLVGNAVKFTKQGHVLVHVHVVGERLRVEVADSGIGIPRERQERLFTPFTQADASIGRHFGGTGLGLVISRRLAQLMGGDIALQSELGVGSTFIIDIPLAVASPLPSLAPVDGISGLRILVVDDLELGRRVAAGLLRAAGCQVDEASSGGEALGLLWAAAAEGARYRAAVVDWRMPGMDGIELARAIKSDPLLAETALVMATAHGQRCDARMAGEAGCAGFLVKPARGDVLAGVVAEAVRRADHGVGGVATRADLAATVDVRDADERFPVRILLVEDNQVNQFIAKAMLERLGVSVVVAGDGRQALNLLEDDRDFQLVLMDCRMPVMDGFEATAEIRRRQAAWSWQPVIIALTANAFDEDRERCLAVGMDDFLTKPLAERVLVACLKRWIEP